MTSNIRHCKVCEKLIKTRDENVGARKKFDGHLSSPLTTVTSEEGVCFRFGPVGKGGANRWFCNDCWKQILEYVNENN